MRVQKHTSSWSAVTDQLARTYHSHQHENLHSAGVATLGMMQAYCKTVLSGMQGGGGPKYRDSSAAMCYSRQFCNAAVYVHSTFVSLSLLNVRLSC